MCVLTDSSNKEQLGLCFCLVNKELQELEEFLGLYQLTDTSVSTLVAVIMDCLLRMNLNISRCRGQCYDGVGSIAGCKTGVTSK